MSPQPNGPMHSGEYQADQTPNKQYLNRREQRMDFEITANPKLIWALSETKLVYQRLSIVALSRRVPYHQENVNQQFKPVPNWQELTIEKLNDGPKKAIRCSSQQIRLNFKPQYLGRRTKHRRRTTTTNTGDTTRSKRRRNRIIKLCFKYMDVANHNFLEELYIPNHENGSISIPFDQKKENHRSVDNLY